MVFWIENSNEVAADHEAGHAHSSSTTPLDSRERIVDVNDKELESGVEVVVLAHIEKAETSATDDIDPNLVDWDGPDDPENPRNWSNRKRIIQLSLISLLMLMSDVTPSMFAPASMIFLRDFEVKSTVLQSLSITIYLLGFSAGPLILGPLSELYGRRIIYRVCTGSFVLFVLACSLSPNVAFFLAAFLLSGCAASGPFTISGGTAVDVVQEEKRGLAMAIISLGPLTGPFIGPLTGGFIAQNYGWRWVFRVNAIFAGIMFVLSMLIMKESNPATILNRKIALIRKESGNQNLRTKYDLEISASALLRRSIICPLKMLIFSPVVLAMSIYGALTMALTVMLYTNFQDIFFVQYGFSSGAAGAAYLGVGVGMAFGLVAFSLLSDRMLKKQVKGGLMKPEYRLPLMIYSSIIAPIGFVWYGWSAQMQAHYMLTIAGTTVVGFGFILTTLPSNLYIIDAFGAYAASALAASSLLRSILGTFLPILGPQLEYTIGIGWGNTVLGFLSLACLPVPWFLYIYGEKLRARWTVSI